MMTFVRMMTHWAKNKTFPIFLVNRRKFSIHFFNSCKENICFVLCKINKKIFTSCSYLVLYECSLSNPTTTYILYTYCAKVPNPKKDEKLSVVGVALTVISCILIIPLYSVPLGESQTQNTPRFLSFSTIVILTCNSKTLSKYTYYT